MDYPSAPLAEVRPTIPLRVMARASISANGTEGVRNNVYKERIDLDGLKRVSLATGPEHCAHKHFRKNARASFHLRSLSHKRLTLQARLCTFSGLAFFYDVCQE